MKYDPGFYDTKVLYTTILTILKSMRGQQSVCYHFGLLTLAKCLIICGPNYLDYAAVFDEQGIVRRDPIVVPSTCDACLRTLDGWLRGKIFKCLNCLDTDLCAACYTTWHKSDGEMELCKGHTFYEIPRPCWYTFEPGIVTEDGETLPEVIEFLEDHFEGLLGKLVKTEQICL
jgi:hypothetical protein